MFPNPLYHIIKLPQGYYNTLKLFQPKAFFSQHLVVSSCLVLLTRIRLGVMRLEGPLLVFVWSLDLLFFAGNPRSKTWFPVLPLRLNTELWPPWLVRYNGFNTSFKISWSSFLRQLHFIMIANQQSTILTIQHSMKEVNT